MIEVRTLTVDDIQWPYDRAPYFTCSRTVEIDPCPAYSHDAKLFLDTLTRLNDFWPAAYDLVAWVLPREVTHRTNGFSDREFPWSPHGPQKPPIHHIIASAKRIPPHPAMTAYLAAHEYGHHVEWWLNAKLYPDERYPFGGGGRDGELLADYAKFRTGCLKLCFGNGGVWHQAVQEVFACDFRLFAGIETSYWPHPGIPRLEECQAAVDWWKYRYKQMGWTR